MELTINLSIPDAVWADLVAALRARHPELAGLTDQQVVVGASRILLRQEVASHREALAYTAANAQVAAAENARAESARQARQAAIDSFGAVT